MVTKPDIGTLDAAGLGRALYDRHYDPLEVLDYYLDRVRAAGDQTVFIALTEHRARADAAAASKRYREGKPLGPLDGVPIAWKDLIDVAGSVTTAGSDIHRQREAATRDANIVSNAAQAGIVSLGKTNLSEFAFSGVGLNPHYGNPRNPRDAKVHRVTGGSSSGSAAALAGGLAPLALGTDTGGSIRIPAALCGLVGYKPSEGQIDKQGIHPLSLTLDCPGPIALSVRDCILLERAFRHQLVVAPRAAGLSDLTVVVPTNIVFDGAQDAVAANFEACLSKLAKAGVKIERRRLTPYDSYMVLVAKHGTFAAAEAYFIHRDLLEGPEHPDRPGERNAAEAQLHRIDPRVGFRIAQGKKVTAFDYIALQQGRRALVDELYAGLRGSVLVAQPTVPVTAPEAAPLLNDTDAFFRTNTLLLRNTTIGNFFNMPSFALPSGTDSQGLPTSIQFAARGGEDEMLICYIQSIDKLLRA